MASSTLDRQEMNSKGVHRQIRLEEKCRIVIHFFFVCSSGLSVSNVILCYMSDFSCYSLKDQIIGFFFFFLRVPTVIFIN